MIKFILLGILLVFTVHQAFAQNVTMTTDNSDYYFLIGDDVAVGAMVNSSFPNTLTGNIEYTTVVTVRQPGMQTVNTNVGFVLVVVPAVVVAAAAVAVVAIVAVVVAIVAVARSFD